MLLAFYLVFCIITVPFLFMRDRLAGTIYGMLFLYSIFALFGYLYMPGLSEGVRAFFGVEVGYAATAFIFASMILIFALNMFIYRKPMHQRARIGFTTNFELGRRISLVGISIPYLFAAMLVVLAFVNADMLSWADVQQEQPPLIFAVFIATFKFSVGILIVLYVFIRENTFSNTQSLFIPAIGCAIIFFVISFLIGNRTDPAALVVGILFYESSRRKLDFKLIAKSAVIILTAIILLSVVEFFRYENNQSVTTLTERIVRNDYFAPAHMLFAAIAFDFVDAGEVWRSFSSNALILMNYPYLQQTITDLFAEGVATRSAGFAFYVLSEGYIALGFFGVFYNAVVVSFFIRVWHAISCTDSRFLNLLIQTLLATMSINVVRTQSSQFIKILYTYFLPVMIIAAIMLTLTIGLRRRAVRADLVSG